MTPLHRAAVQGNDEELERLLALGIPVNAHLSRDRATPLYVAAESQRAKPSTLRILIGAGADPNAQDALGSGPLYKAKDLETMKILVEAGADPLHISRGGYSVLSAARTIEEAEFLLSLGVDPNVRSNWGETCLTRAALWRGPELTRFLLANGSDPEVACWTDLHIAVAKGHYDEVRLRLAKGEDPLCVEPSFWSAWHLCVRLGDTEMAAQFMNSGVDINAEVERGFQPFIAACESAPLATVQWLLANGADPNKPDDFGSTALMRAAGRGEVAIVKCLLEAGAAVGAENQVQSQAITETGNIEVVRLLVAAGADVNYIDGQGQFLLATAVCGGDSQFTRGLLNMGADPNIDLYGSSALMIAAASNELEIARILLDAGADPAYVDCDGDTVLSRIYSGTMARMLLEAGADTTVKDDGGNFIEEKSIWPEVAEALGLNPTSGISRGLYDAAGCGDSDLVRYFLSLGANPNYQTSWEASPLLEAAESHSLDVVELLLQANADALHVDYMGNGALHYACGASDIKYGFSFSGEVESTNPALIDRLLSAGIPANLPNEGGLTPLSVAVLAKRPIAVLAMAEIASENVKAAARSLAKEKLKNPELSEVLVALQ